MDSPPRCKVVSGGPTGIDQLGLNVAKSLGILTGGVAPKGFLTENGPHLLLRDEYGLTEHASPDYRTRANVQQSDGTVLFREISGGTKLTIATCEKEGKPYLVNPTAEQLRAWLIEQNINILNVAGNRGTKLKPEKREQYQTVLRDALSAACSIS